jgi:DNA polymerase
MDELAWLQLQVQWGADEALEERPVDRRVRQSVPAPRAATAPARLPAMPPPAASAGPNGVARAQALAAAATTVAELRAALVDFDGCALRATATNLVFAEGDPASGLVLIADVPGAAEDRAGRPFAGPAGLFLDRMLASAGLDRAAALSTSLLPWRPPGDRKPTDAEIQLCLPFLHRHLALLRPRRAVLLGGLAARTLLPGTGRRPRGVWHDMALPGLALPIPTLALPSPAHIQATPACKRDAWADLLRLRRALDTDGPHHE